MKKLYFIAALAAIGLASCTSEDEIRTASADEAINFKAVTHKPSRGAITENYIPASTRIYVTAYQRDGSIFTPYFTNREFSNGVDKTGYWTSTGANWPQTGTLDMIAYACDYGDDKVVPDVTVATEDQRISKLTLDFTQENTAKAKKQLDGQTDVIYSGMALGMSKANSKDFHLAFKHSLAWIIVNFVADVDDPARNAFKIRKVNLEDVRLTGINELTVAYTETGGVLESTVTSSWKEGVGPVVAKKVFPAYKAYNSDTSEGMLFGDAASQDNLGLLIVPGNQTAISFEYATRNGGGVDGEPATFTDWIPYEIKLTPTDKWEAGNVYTYNVKIDAKGIQFTAGVRGWDDEDGNLINGEILGN